ncbi:hypothetical protein, partial [Klebsiella pneumoniae]|uniref:hypothetical protein n=1 Tax=Klebsiella pneumoniae TaxID=573 RepID=UPI001C708DD1
WDFLSVRQIAANLNLNMVCTRVWLNSATTRGSNLYMVAAQTGLELPVPNETGQSFDCPA